MGIEGMDGLLLLFAAIASRKSARAPDLPASVPFRDERVAGNFFLMVGNLKGMLFYSFIELAYILTNLGCTSASTG